MILEYGQIERVSTLIDIKNFDELFDVSFPAMENGTYKWPKEIDTQEKKREYYKTIIGNCLADTSKSFSFKRVVDGRDISLNVGYRTHDGYWTYQHAMVNNVNGSRSWIFDERVTPQQTQYLINNGFVGIILQSFGEADTTKHQLKKYENLPYVEFDTSWTNENGILFNRLNFNASVFHSVVMLSDTRLS